MKRILMIAFAVVFFLSGCSAEEGIVVHNAWVRPTTRGENGAVYFVIQNNSGATAELIAASSNVAESVEMHESSIAEGDVMRMQQVFSVSMEHRSEIIFEPGGLHVMLVNVNRDLELGEYVELILHFKNHEDIPVTVSVSEFAPDEHDH
ncbi:MAG TPA: copper chaperone PCu(A)C [Anaerolineales bacterium]|nr:copper chaperone PCu(A)C [Anaerolineales bacterium]